MLMYIVTRFIILCQLYNFLKFGVQLNHFAVGLERQAAVTYDCNGDNADWQQCRETVLSYALLSLGKMIYSMNFSFVMIKIELCDFKD